jgi:HxlR-like helix-turn-helix/Alkyl sulfatase C-terminal
MFGPRRFGEIRANLPGISANVLTQRLGGLEAAGIVVRRRLPSPANVQVYELTPWGLEAEPVMTAMGRWATRSRRHDPTLFMSPASAMIALRTLFDAPRAGGDRLTIAFRFPDDAFIAEAADGEVCVRRGDGRADATFVTDTATLLSTIFGKAPFEKNEAAGAVSVEGDRAAAARFVDLFHLPEKIA